VAQTGVQVLFGFLLAVAFTQRFRSSSTFQQADYFATLIATCVAAILLIAPTSYHRILYRLGDKQHIVRTANRYTMAGLVAIALAMVGVVTLVSDLLLNPPLTAVVAVLTAGGCATTWYILPFARRRKITAIGSGKRGGAAQAGGSGSNSDPTLAGAGDTQVSWVD
jgi:Flp pilus assembly protein TadB